MKQEAPCINHLAQMNITEGCYREKFDASYVRNNRINVMQIHVLSAGVRVTLSFIEFNQLSSASTAAAEFERCEVHFGMQFAGRISSLSKKLPPLLGVSRLLSSRIASRNENFAVHRREQRSSRNGAPKRRRISNSGEVSGIRRPRES